ncbi:hypothetical protein Q8A67_025833 [Cirrhinus molitorella]|uniref:Uncharacterized protein n=1 Tax=Cirrhinus molitorella TaxID=172907 RepID=A0AA88T7P8_9TELE|nr:hypothetical protein Q8A67_025833 [Cirrhinus molitorella]
MPRTDLTSEHRLPRRGGSSLSDRNITVWKASEDLCKEIHWGRGVLNRPWGQLCASMFLPREPSDRKKELAMGGFREATETYDWPNRLQKESAVRRACWLHYSAFPGCEQPRALVEPCLTPKRRWRVSCDMQLERKSPWQMMYAMVAKLSVRTST